MAVEIGSMGKFGPMVKFWPMVKFGPMVKFWLMVKFGPLVNFWEEILPPAVEGFDPPSPGQIVWPVRAWSNESTASTLTGQTDGLVNVLASGQTADQRFGRLSKRMPQPAGESHAIDFWPAARWLTSAQRFWPVVQNAPARASRGPPQPAGESLTSGQMVDQWSNGWPVVKTHPLARLEVRHAPAVRQLALVAVPVLQEAVWPVVKWLTNGQMVDQWSNGWPMEWSN